MVDIALFLLPYIGAVIALVLFGLIADSLTSSALKDYVNDWINRSRRFTDLTRDQISLFLNSFLDGFIHRIFGNNIFSIRFFLRTCTVTVCFFLLAVLLQAFFYNTKAFEQFRVLINRPSEAFIYLVSLLFLNFIIDYLSNIQTVSFLRMAARSGKIFDTLLVFIADITLTITVFTIIYPFGILIDVVVNQIINRPAIVAMTRVSPWEKMLVEDRYTKNIAKLTNAPIDFSIQAYNVTTSYANNTYQFNRVVIYAPKSISEEDAILKFIEFAKKIGVVRTAEIDFHEKEVKLKITIWNQPINPKMIVQLYYSAYRLSNIMRDSFLSLIRLEPLQIHFTNVIGEYAYYINVAENPMPERVGVSCWGGESKVVEWTRLDEAHGCQTHMLILAPEPYTLLWDFRRISSMDDEMPITPFFFTSFATSILYYFTICIFLIGALVLRYVRAVFATGYLETKNRPFTILSIFAAIPIIILQNLLNVIS